jgi:hypothetical protein
MSKRCDFNRIFSVYFNDFCKDGESCLDLDVQMSKKYTYKKRQKPLPLPTLLLCGASFDEKKILSEKHHLN